MLQPRQVFLGYPKVIRAVNCFAADFNPLSEQLVWNVSCSSHCLHKQSCFLSVLACKYTRVHLIYFPALFSLGFLHFPMTNNIKKINRKKVTYFCLHVMNKFFFCFRKTLLWSLCVYYIPLDFFLTNQLSRWD